jgi:hypothetical protein
VGVRERTKYHSAEVNELTLPQQVAGLHCTSQNLHIGVSHSAVHHNHTVEASLPVGTQYSVTTITRTTIATINSKMLPSKCIQFILHPLLRLVQEAPEHAVQVGREVGVTPRPIEWIVTSMQ